MLNSLLLVVILLQPGFAQLGAQQPAQAPGLGQPPVQQSAGQAPTVQPTEESNDDGIMKLFLYFTVFVLAVFVGFEIITKVPPTLHTPLMSGSNAISGITLIGAMLMTGSNQGGFATFLGFLSVVFATMNVVGGFLVTHRMLEMFQKK